MRLILLLAILLLPLPVSASPLLLLMGNSAPEDPPISFTINSYSSISSAGTTDTGTATVATGRGYISTDADCTGSASGSSSVYLVVDGGIRATAFCDEVQTPYSATLTYFVEAGDHSVRIWGETFGETFQADNFLKPTPP